MADLEQVLDDETARRAATWFRAFLEGRAGLVVLHHEMAVPDHTRPLERTPERWELRLGPVDPPSPQLELKL